MQSSPTDLLLRQLAEVYDRGYQALTGDEFGQLDKLMEQAEALIEDMRSQEPGSRAALSQVQESHGRLGSALGQAMQAARGDLSKIRRGRQDLKRFIRRSDEVGQRVRSEI